MASVITIGRVKNQFLVMTGLHQWFLHWYGQFCYVYVDCGVKWDTTFCFLMITIIPWARISSKPNLLEKKTFEPQCLTTIIWYISEGYFIVIALPKALWLSKGQMISLRIVEDSFDHHSKSQELLVILQLISLDVLSRETTFFVPDIYIYIWAWRINCGRFLTRLLGQFV